MKKFLFDMDGTIADLYNEPNWLGRLLAEEKGLFENLQPMHDYKQLTTVINRLATKGELAIITWTPKNVSRKYVNRVAREKRNWLKKYFPQFTEIHVLDYGTPKQKAEMKKRKNMYLIDDNHEVLAKWETPKERKAILADHQLIEKLWAII